MNVGFSEDAEREYAVRGVRNGDFDGVRNKLPHDGFIVVFHDPISVRLNLLEQLVGDRKIRRDLVLANGGNGQIDAPA